LLDVEKLESGTMELDYALISIPELVASAVNQVGSLADSVGLTLKQTVSDDAQTLMGDESKIRRTLVNLIGNALKFTPRNGVVSVQVHASKDGKSAIFCVIDTGEGIPAEAFGRIFEKFGQVESRKAGRMMSTGLGLTFCKLAVEAHHGQIGVDSVLGQGSTFWFTIPIGA